MHVDAGCDILKKRKIAEVRDEKAEGECSFRSGAWDIVNMLFCLSLLIRVGWLTVMTYLVWVAYLVFCIKHAESKASKIINTVFLVIAAVLACVNLYFMF